MFAEGNYIQTINLVCYFYFIFIFCLFNTRFKLICKSFR